MSQETVEQTFTVTSPARLKLSNISGSVEIRPGDDGMMQVTAVKRTHKGDPQRTQIELSQAADGTVTAATRFNEGWWVWLVGSYPCEVDYTIKAPRACSLKVSGVSNTAVVEGLTGEFTFNSVSGELTLRDLAGPVQIHTVSGSVDGERLAGALHLDSVSGDVRLRECTIPSAEAKTVSGGLDIETALSQGPYHFNSVSGDLRLTVPADTHCTLELHTVSGNISADGQGLSALPLSTNARSNGKRVAEVQGGGVRVEMHSVSGGLRIGIPPGAKTLAVEPRLSPRSADPAPEPPKSVDRHTLLERIERGEITVEEGLRLLRG